MATMASRKTISIHDYPEHLNPFHEEDNHNKIRFWTIGRRLSRSNSITFTGIKDLKNSWAFRSFLKKGKKGQQTSQEKKPNTQVNGDTSPIVYRRAMQYSTSSTTPTRNTVGSPDRYVYGGSITPLPRSRFQERLRSTSNHEVNSLSLTPRMARSEVSGSRLSVESTNPFDEDPVPPVRASRRKKKRAPLPPPATAADISINSESSELQITEGEDINESKATSDLEIRDAHLDVELKIVEDEDVKSKAEATTPDTVAVTNKEAEGVDPNSPSKETIDSASISSQDENVRKEETESENRDCNINKTLNITEDHIKNSGSEDDILNKVSFSKVDITKYRRNSSVNEDDIKLRRGNLEDFHSLSNKRSKSLNNDLDTTFVTYDINLNENIVDKDANDNVEPQKVICKLYDEPTRKQSIDTISSTEKEFIEIDKATREFEIEINKLTSALNNDDDFTTGARLSVSDIKKRFDKDDVSSPNPIPKPRRSHYGGNSPVIGNYQ